MKRLLLIAMLAACGDKKSEAPAANVGAVVKRDETPLEEAKRLLTTVPKREPKAWVALAHAQAVKQLPEAKATLDAALASARADDGDTGTIALAHAVEVASLLGRPDAAAILDEVVARIGKERDVLAILFAPSERLTFPTVIDRLAPLATDHGVLDAVLQDTSPEQLPALVKAVHAMFEEKRTEPLTILARQARRMGKPDKSLIDEAAKLAQKDMFQDEVEVATEAAKYGDAELAKKLVAGVPKIAHSQEAAERAGTFSSLAWIYTLAGDKAAAEGAEKKALQAAEAGHEEIDDGVYMELAAARAKRGNFDGALALIKEHIKDKEAEGDVAYLLADAGDLDGAKRILESITSDWRFPATADIVEELARRDPEAAKALVLAAPQQKAMSPGIEHVMRAYALRGDVQAVRELGTRDRMGTKQGQLDVFTALAARSLAAKGDCPAAIAASKDVAVNRGEHLAVIARFCP